ncbi:MAG: tetratricopeptide repeat protein [Alphaproteobacteria bacterium]
MTAEIGHLALFLALVLTLAQSVFPILGAVRRNALWMGVAEPAAVGALVYLAIAFIALVRVFVTSDVSVAAVVAGSNPSWPLLDRVTGVFASRGGFLVFSVLVLGLFGTAVVLFGRKLPPVSRVRVLSLQGAIAAGFLILVLFAENPFLRFVPAAGGADLSPMLEGPGAYAPALQPGYAGMPMGLSFAIAIMTITAIAALMSPLVRGRARSRQGDAAGRASRQDRFKASRAARLTLMAAAIAGPMAALALYIAHGSPALPDRPIASRDADQGPFAETSIKDTARLEAMVDRLVAATESNRDDLDGWKLLARAYMTLGKYPEAAHAYSEAARLDASDAALPASQGEALVYAGDGAVTAEAQVAFAAALAIDGKEPRSRFYTGLARLQAGEPDKALAAWKALAADAPKDAPWLPRLSEQIARLNDVLAAGPKAPQSQAEPAPESQPERMPVPKTGGPANDSGAPDQK